MSNVTREEVISEIQRVAKTKEQNWLSRSQFFAESKISDYQLKRHFPSWNAAVTASGLSPLGKSGRPDQQRGHKKKDLIDAIQDVAKQHGRRYVSITEFSRKTGISERPIYRIFGSWDRFVQEAGLELHPAHKKKIPDEELFAEFFRLTDELGHFPAYSELRHAKYSSGTFESRFGNYTEFKVHALQFGLDHKRIEPELLEKQTPLPRRQRDNGVSYAELTDRPILGNRIDFRGLLHAPVNELGVVYLFGILSQELGFVVESVQSGFPDCTAKRRLPKDRWQSVRIEFEFRSSNFVAHGHDLTQCDMIVCWEHNWADCPIEVISLREIVEERNGLTKT